MRHALALAVLAACGSSSPRAAAPPPTAAAAGDVAYLGTSKGLVAVSLATGEVTPRAPGAVSWCAADNLAQVVWYIAGGKLAAFDLTGGPELTVVEGDLEADEVIIDHGERGKLGGGDPVDFQIALEVSLAAGSLGVTIGCDGDAAHYCYEEDLETLIPELESRRAATGALKAADPERLRALRARGAGRSLWSPEPPADEAQELKVEVDAAACEEVPEDCGAARPLPGTPYWLVITANSRGDYFHQDRQLYDPARREFFAAGKRSAKPLPEAPSTDGMLVAPSGQGYLLGADVVHFERGVVHAGGEAVACGWAGGGWRVGGPRED